MPIEKVKRSLSEVIKNTGLTIKEGVKTIKNSPQILAYPYLAAMVVLVTFPTVNTFAFWLWNHFAHGSIFSAVDDTPHTVRIVLGLVTFSFFYTIFITAFFTCAISAETLECLDGKKPRMLHGLKEVGRRFLRVAHFALLAVFYFPIAVFVQRHKLRKPKGFIDVFGSSLSLSMSQLSPAILTSKKSISATINDSIGTLGKFWRESLVIKIGMYLSILGIGLLGFLPKLAEHYWFDSETAHIIGWLVSTLLWLIGYIFVKVIGNVFTSVLYWHSFNGENKE